MYGKNHKDEGYLVTNKVEHGVQVSTQPSETAAIFGFAAAGSATPSDLEARQWIDAIKNNTAPLVKPEEAIVVTRILEAIYTSAATGKAVSF
jgi:predicted dehydrogenase